MNIKHIHPVYEQEEERRQKIRQLRKDCGPKQKTDKKRTASLKR